MCSVRWPKNEEMINEADYHLGTNNYRLLGTILLPESCMRHHIIDRVDEDM